jgi:hypothetical protein
MRFRLLLSVLSVLLFCISVSAQVPARKIDTSMKVGKVGYRIICKNSSPEKNIVSITPLGFDKEMREFSFEVKGRITRGEVDDINRDGFPDLVFYVFSNDSIPRGSVVGITSEKNETVVPVSFPDIFDDPKLRVGYKGNDQFFLMEGILVRRFPVYPVEGAPANAQGGNLIRQIQYNVVPGERGGLRFKPGRSYDFVKQ